MRHIVFCLLAVSALLGCSLYGLIAGQGSFPRVFALENESRALEARENSMRSANDALEREIQFMKSGSDAVEERARYDLNMIEPTEILFKIK